MKRKIFALMMSCAMVLSMTACGAKEDGGKSDGGASVSTPSNDGGASVNTPNNDGGASVTTPNNDGGASVITPNDDGGASANTPEPSALEDSGITGRNVSGLMMNIPDGFTMTEWDDINNEVHVVQFAADNGAWIRVAGPIKAADIAPQDFNEYRFKEFCEYSYGCSDVVCDATEVSDWIIGRISFMATGIGSGTINGEKFNLARQNPFTPVDDPSGREFYYNIMYVYPDDMKDTFTGIMDSVTLTSVEEVIKIYDDMREIFKALRDAAGW